MHICSASIRNNLDTRHLCPNLEKNGPFWQSEKYSKQKIITPQHRENVSALKRTFFFPNNKREKPVYVNSDLDCPRMQRKSKM